MKDILIIAHFAFTPGKSHNSRFHDIACLIKEKSCEIELVTTSFAHGKKKQKEYSQGDLQKLPYKYTTIYEPGYNKNVCLKRLISHRIMSKNLKKYLNKRQKPDIIYCTVPSLDVAKVAAQYAKKNNIRFIIDVQDLWPEAFKMVFNIPIISNLIYAPMKRTADYIYKQADEIVAVSDTYCERALMVNKKCSKSHTVFLGTQLSQFDYNVEQNHVELDRNYFYVAYCGTLGHSYDIRCVIDALDILKKEKEMDNIKFIVMGDGPLKHEFEAYAISKNINVEFTGRLDYGKMCGLLAACDIAVNPISQGAAQSIINKHADYAAAGIPVISTQECQEYRELVEKYNMGFNCENGDSKEVANCIKKLIDSVDLRREMSVNARRCAEEKFNRGKTYNEISQLFN